LDAYSDRLTLALNRVGPSRAFGFAQRKIDLATEALDGVLESGAGEDGFEQNRAKTFARWSSDYWTAAFPPAEIQDPAVTDIVHMPRRANLAP
jgi:hypothetical protein